LGAYALLAVRMHVCIRPSIKARRSSPLHRRMGRSVYVQVTRTYCTLGESASKRHALSDSTARSQCRDYHGCACNDTARQLKRICPVRSDYPQAASDVGGHPDFRKTRNTSSKSLLPVGGVSMATRMELVRFDLTGRMHLPGDGIQDTTAGSRSQARSMNVVETRQRTSRNVY